MKITHEEVQLQQEVELEFWFQSSNLVQQFIEVRMKALLWLGLDPDSKWSFIFASGLWKATWYQICLKRHSILCTTRVLSNCNCSQFGRRVKLWTLMKSYMINLICSWSKVEMISSNFADPISAGLLQILERLMVAMIQQSVGKFRLVSSINRVQIEKQYLGDLPANLSHVPD